MMKKYIVTINDGTFHGIAGLEIRGNKVYYKNYVLNVSDLEGALLETYLGKYSNDEGFDEWVEKNPKRVYKQLGNMIEDYRLFKPND